MFKRWLVWKQINTSRLGFICFHIGYAIIAGGVLVTTLGKFQGAIEVAQNQGFIDRQDYYEWTEGPFIGTPGYSGEFFF